MKCHWDTRKIHEVDALNMGFSELQAFQIRNTLEKADSRAASTCTTTADAYRGEPEDSHPGSGCDAALMCWFDRTISLPPFSAVATAST